MSAECGVRNDLILIGYALSHMELEERSAGKFLEKKIYTR